MPFLTPTLLFSRAWGRLSGALDCTPLRQRKVFKFWATCTLGDMNPRAHENTLVNIRNLSPSTKAQNAAILKKSKILQMLGGYNPPCERRPIFVHSLDLVHPESHSTVFESPKSITAFSSYLSTKKRFKKFGGSSSPTFFTKL